MFSRICDNWHPDEDRNGYTLKGLRVLAVDDNEDSLELVRIILEDYSVQVITVTSASEALRAIATVLPDILICDIAMPLVDGYSLLRRIRTFPPEQGGSIPAIALTAFATDVERTLALNAGFQKHLTKPVEPTVLVKVVSELARQIQHQHRVA